MLLHKAVVLFVIASSTFQNAKGLMCYSCNSVDSNSKCRRRVSCFGSVSCSNEVRMENGLLRITKKCEQLGACIASSRQNSRQCSPSVQSSLRGFKVNGNLPPSVCRSCCTTNNCNSRLFLQEASQSKNRNAKPRWRPSRPSIRDVKVTLLSPDTALITFKDLRNHSVEFFNVNVIPRRRSKVNPVLIHDDSLPEIDFTVPDGALAYLVRDLSAGKFYRISVTSKKRSRFYAQKIFKSFVTRPRRPTSIRSVITGLHSLSVWVEKPRLHPGDGFASYSLTYRKASDPPKSAKRLPDFNRPQITNIRGLQPSTKYILSAWTNVLSVRGRHLGSSAPTNVTLYTAVPGIQDIKLIKRQATSLTWTFRVDPYGNPRTQKEFVVKVRDDTNGVLEKETVISQSSRSFSIHSLTPMTEYTMTIAARANGFLSEVASSASVMTLVRCYGCRRATTKDSCYQHIECPPETGGCMTEIAVPKFSENATSNWYSATLTCKAQNLCNQTLDATQCNPQTNRFSAFKTGVCRCCCEGDLCNGPGSSCGSLLGWLDPVRDPGELISPFCPEIKISNGAATCTNGLEIGSVCTLSCNPYWSLDGQKTVSCTTEGTWSVKIPECKPAESCKSITPVLGTIVTCSSDYIIGSVCRISCVDGYLLAGGENTVQCQRTGQWNLEEIPSCLEEDNCQPNPCRNSARCHDLVNDFECECTPGWTGKVCDEVVFCEMLSKPENGNLECSNENKYLSRCRYSCNEGYEMHGSTFTRCLADGYWSSYEPTLCIIKSCKVPPQKLVNRGKTHCSGYEVGDTCHFSCPAGLVVSGGPSNITCQTDTKWSSHVPCCDLKCPPHSKIDVYFLLDSSSSVGAKNWKILVNFTIALLDQFIISSDDMVVGVGRFNRWFDAKNEILFGDYKNSDDLKNKIRAIPYNGRGTRMGRALNHVHKYSLNAPGNRPNIPNIVVLITDGVSADDVSLPASRIKNSKQAKIYVVGVVNRFNDINHKELQIMASGPNYVQVIHEGYESLARTLSAKMVQDVCWLPCDFQYELREIYLRRRQLLAKVGDKLDALYWSKIDAGKNATHLPGNRTEPHPDNEKLITPPSEKLEDLV